MLSPEPEGQHTFKAHAQIIKQEIDTKRYMAQFYLDHYGLTISEWKIQNLTEQNLLIKLETRAQILREHKAASMI